jgi:soluble lytic murein transglycosylase-like protein
MMNDMRFFYRLVRSAFAAEPRRRRVPVFMGSAVLALVLPVSGFYAASVASAMDSGTASVESLVSRAQTASRALHEIEASYESEITPIEQVLLNYRNDPELVRQISVSLVGQGKRAGVDPKLLLAVMLVENPMLEPGARSPAGAHGLMQVMPGHRGQWKPCGPNLDGVEDNICYGARIFASNLREEDGNVEKALLSYNGCHKSANCQVYANYVYERAGRASILASVHPARRHAGRAE